MQEDATAEVLERALEMHLGGCYAPLAMLTEGRGDRGGGRADTRRDRNRNEGSGSSYEYSVFKREVSSMSQTLSPAGTLCALAHTFFVSFYFVRI